MKQQTSCIERLHTHPTARAAGNEISHHILTTIHFTTKRPHFCIDPMCLFVSDKFRVLMPFGDYRSSSFYYHLRLFRSVKSGIGTVIKCPVSIHQRMSLIVRYQTTVIPKLYTNRRVRWTHQRPCSTRTRTQAISTIAIACP